MAKILRISANQSLRYLALLQERLAKLQHDLATRERVIDVRLPTYREPIPPPPPPIAASCELYKLKALSRGKADEILARIFLATSEALSGTPKGRKPRPPA